MLARPPSRLKAEPSAIRLEAMREIFPVLQRLLVSRGADRTARVVRFVIVGGLATVLSFVLVILCVELLGIDPVVSVAVVYLLILVAGYFAQRLWVFESQRPHAAAFPRFVISSVIAMLLNTSIMAITVHVLERWYVIGLIVATVVLPTTSFLLNRYWAFHPARPDRPR